VFTKKTFLKLNFRRIFASIFEAFCVVFASTSDAFLRQFLKPFCSSLFSPDDDHLDAVDDDRLLHDGRHHHGVLQEEEVHLR
jgi:hypothetical protein